MLITEERLSRLKQNDPTLFAWVFQEEIPHGEGISKFVDAVKQNTYCQVLIFKNLDHRESYFYKQEFFCSNMNELFKGLLNTPHGIQHIVLNNSGTKYAALEELIKKGNVKISLVITELSDSPEKEKDFCRKHNIQYYLDWQSFYHDMYNIENFKKISQTQSCDSLLTKTDSLAQAFGLTRQPFYEWLAHKAVEATVAYYKQNPCANLEELFWFLAQRREEIAFLLLQEEDDEKRANFGRKRPCERLETSIVAETLKKKKSRYEDYYGTIVSQKIPAINKLAETNNQLVKKEVSRSYLNNSTSYKYLMPWLPLKPLEEEFPIIKEVDNSIVGSYVLIQSPAGDLKNVFTYVNTLFMELQDSTKEELITNTIIKIIHALALEAPTCRGTAAITEMLSKTLFTLKGISYSYNHPLPQDLLYIFTPDVESLFYGKENCPFTNIQFIRTTDSTAEPPSVNISFFSNEQPSEDNFSSKYTR